MRRSWAAALGLCSLLGAAGPARADWLAFAFWSNEVFSPEFAGSPLDRIVGEVRTDRDGRIFLLRGRSMVHGEIVGPAAPAWLPDGWPGNGAVLRFRYADGWTTSLGQEPSSRDGYQFTCLDGAGCAATRGDLGIIELPPLPAVPEPGTAATFAIALSALFALGRGQAARPAAQALGMRPSGV